MLYKWCFTHVGETAYIDGLPIIKWFMYSLTHQNNPCMGLTPKLSCKNCDGWKSKGLLTPKMPVLSFTTHVL